MYVYHVVLDGLHIVPGWNSGMFCVRVLPFLSFLTEGVSRGQGPSVPSTLSALSVVHEVALYCFHQ